MAYRFTDTDKWKDPWFRSLNPNEKLLFDFLCDNCDLGGFYEVDIPMISFLTKLSEEEIKAAFKGLLRGYLGADGWIWIINFLKHQKNLPLNPENNAHKHIINLIKVQLIRFPNIPNLLGANEGLFSPIGKGKVVVKVKVKDEVDEKFLETECDKFKGQYEKEMIKDFINHWSEKNKKGKQKWEMEDTWETSKRLATWYSNSLKWNKGKGFQKPETSNVYQGMLPSLAKKLKNEGQ